MMYRSFPARAPGTAHTRSRTGRGLLLGRLSLLWAEPSIAEIAASYLESGTGQLKRSTVAAYRTVAEKHIIPCFGAWRISQVTDEAVAAFLRRKAAGTAGLSPSTLCGIVTVLRAVLRHAEANGYPTAVTLLKRPKLVTRESKVLTEEEQRRLEDFLLTDLTPDRLGILVCLYTGLRLGEICALRWGDISDTGLLSVRRTVQRIKTSPADGDDSGRQTQLVFDAPKSSHSIRSIPLPSFLRELLLQHRREDGCFLLTGSAARFMEPRVCQKRFQAVLRAAGIRSVNFHALRHTFATRCTELGFDPKTLSRVLGHADVNVTLNTYVHPSLSQMRSCMELLDRGGG